MTSPAGSSARQRTLERLRGGLVVSCQAREGHPMAGPTMMAAFARCAELGGAVGLRVNGAADVRAVRAGSELPVLGIAKQYQAGARPFITPDLDSARAVVEAGATMVAVEAVPDYRPDPGAFAALCASIHEQLQVPVVADVSTLAEGLAAADAGADAVATTLSGYTAASPPRDTPDLDLAAALAAEGLPTLVEGHVRTADEVAQAFKLGALAVVVGTAITDPVSITRWFAAASPAAAPGEAGAAPAIG
jgi:N-acylglucosamine-6-phosphate 2-epimerase